MLLCIIGLLIKFNLHITVNITDIIIHYSFIFDTLTGFILRNVIYSTLHLFN